MATEGGKGCLVSVAAETEEGANALLGRLLLPARTIAAGLKEAFV